MENSRYKFRAWHKKLKTMFEVCNIQWENGEISGVDLCHQVENKISKVFLEDIRLMQSTGLKDKNGKEIYDGDIIAGTSDEEVNTIVEWIEGQFMVYDIFCLATDEAEDSKVIGNIYENQELLDEEDKCKIQK